MKLSEKIQSLVSSMYTGGSIEVQVREVFNTLAIQLAKEEKEDRSKAFRTALSGLTKDGGIKRVLNELYYGRIIKNHKGAFVNNLYHNFSLTNNILFSWEKSINFLLDKDEAENVLIRAFYGYSI